MNILLGFCNIIVIFTLVILIEKLFKKEGLYVWISIAFILANISVCKTINILNFSTNLGNTLFASIFLATDIMSEKYNKNDAKKGIYLSVFSGIAFIIITQLLLLFNPSSEDLVNDSMKNLFTISLRTSIASIIMFFISNMFDIYLYNKLKEKYPNKMWFRNNLSTILSNCTENYLFTLIAFIGIFKLPIILQIATIASIIEIIIAICDTPFLYISKKLK